MRQLLMLGFYCEVYRREPLCRIYVNDYLIDEFNIPHTPSKDKFTSEKILDPAFWGTQDFSMQSNRPFFKLLELDDAGEKFIDIRVEIQNSDNNYANGFMTRSTRVMLCQCWLAPVKLWEEFDKIKDRWKNSRHNWSKWGGRTKSVNFFYNKRRNIVFDNFAIFADMRFPGIKQQVLSMEQHKEKICNYKDLPQMMDTPASSHWVGASGNFHLNLVKKMGFWRHSTDRRAGWWKLSLIKNVKDIYDKYKQYEDKRNTNQ